MDCRNCGNAIAAGAKHCNKCGAKQYDQHMLQPGTRQTYNQIPEARQAQMQNPGTQQPFMQMQGTQQPNNLRPATQQTQNPGMQQLGKHPEIQQTQSHNPEKQQLHEQHSGIVPVFPQKPEARQPDKQQVGVQQALSRNPEMQQPQRQNPEIKQSHTQPPVRQQTHTQPSGAQQPVNQHFGVPKAIEHPQTPQPPRAPQNYNKNLETKQGYERRPEIPQPTMQRLETQQPHNQRHESPQPFTQNPEAPQPHRQQPGTPQPHRQRPETQQPLRQHPETQQPLRQQLETQQPLRQQPETPQPLRQQPETPQPLRQRPETPQPLMQHLEAPQQLNQRPETLQPLVKNLETPQLNQRPEASQQLNQRPETSQPLMKNLETLNHQPETQQLFGQHPEVSQLQQRSEVQQPYNQRSETQQSHSHPETPKTYYQNPEMHHPGTVPTQTPQPYAGPNTYMPRVNPVTSDKRKMPTFAVGLVAGVMCIGLLLVVAVGLLGSAARRTIDDRDTDIVDRRNIENNALTDSNVLTPTQIFQNNVNGVFKIYAIYDSGNVHGVGSGFLVDAGGIAVTNHHVMAGATKALAILEDGREIDIIGYHSYDISNDLAVIQLDSDGQVFHYLTIGDSDAVQVGQDVYAIGSPLGDRNTFTAGYVSRFATEPIPFGIYSVEGLIQMTAAIYGGSSGGALLNDRGQVIGVNTAGNAFRPSVGWAVPISRLVLPESGSQIHPLPIEEPVQIRREGIFTYERFPFIPDFLSVAANSSLIISGTAESLEWDLLLDFDVDGRFHFSYAYMYDLENWSFLPITDEYDKVLIEHGFEFQGVLNDEEITYVLLYHEGENTSLAYCYYWEESMLLIMIGEGNAYETFLGGRPDLPAGAVLDPELIGSWLFLQTTQEGYQEWMRGGERLFYIFNEDGSGEFIVVDRLGRTTSTFGFVWHTENGSVIIEYYGFFEATYVYRYQFVPDGMEMRDAHDRHLLQREE